MTNSLNGLGLLLILAAVVAVFANHVHEGLALAVPHSERCKAGDLSMDISDCPACANRADLEEVDW